MGVNGNLSTVFKIMSVQVNSAIPMRWLDIASVLMTGNIIASQHLKLQTLVARESYKTEYWTSVTNSMADGDNYVCY